MDVRIHERNKLLVNQYIKGIYFYHKKKDVC
jgi:hypothetical protein